MDELIKPEEMTAIRILLVDDELDFLMSLKMELGKRYKVMTAEDGIEARLMLECKNDFDLIISSQSMPVMNGMELFEWIGKEYPQTPKVLLAELSELTDEIKSQTNENKFYCLDKSLDRIDLLSAIDQAVIGVKPVVMSFFKNEDDTIETQTKPTGCKMAVLDDNTKNWPSFEKLTNQSDSIGEVVYFRNPLLLLERLKKDSSLGVVCINFKKKKSVLNNVIEQISRLKHAANVILICDVDQAGAAVEYQIKGTIYQRVIKPGSASKMLLEIESAAKQFISDNQPIQVPESLTCKPNDTHIIKQSDSLLIHAVR
ncbi:hypothetical protein MNBD_GAMMA01-337 [hydrothermal vent metagenome]|uniref:Response regulatory domain-containing protein n=1 Tax=hydrothermal vent metagenome TaxID=652676 RepID=A0A3B0VFT8_9ZZZZ